MSARANQLLEAGLWLKMSGDLDGARKLFEQALKLDPDSIRARELLGQSVPESEAVADTGGDGDNVLQRATELDSDNIIIGIDAEERVAEVFLHGRGEAAVF